MLDKLRADQANMLHIKVGDVHLGTEREKNDGDKSGTEAYKAEFVSLKVCF